MMRAIVLALLVGAGPVRAEGGMTPESCSLTWDRVLDARAAFTPQWRMQSGDAAVLADLRTQDIAVTPDGLCRLEADQLGLRPGDGLGAVTWWATGLTADAPDGALPDALGVGLSDVVLYRGEGPFDVGVALSHNARDGVLTVDSLRIAGEAGDILRGSGTINGAFFSNLNGAASALGSLRLTDAEATLWPTPALWDMFAVTEAPADLDGGISALSDDQIDPDSRAAAHAFAQAVPDVGGTLRLQMDDAAGLGWMQVLGSGWLSNIPLAERLPIILHGTVIRAEWVADQ